MSSISLKFPDGKIVEYSSGITGEEIAKNISEGLLRIACGIKITPKFDSEKREVYEEATYDLATPITEDASISILTLKDKEGLEILRHTSAHIMAYALEILYPEVLLTIGPVIENGFYYDFDKLKLKQEDLSAIEAEMKKIVDSKYPLYREEISKAEALKLFEKNTYKIELINGFPEAEKISIYKMGEFVDLCRGTHLPHTGMAKVFKLLRLTGAYWRGDSNNTMLTRLYATSFADKKELKQYLEQLALAEERDHNKLGRELGYFTTDEVVGKGLPLLTAKGSTIKRILQRFIEDEEIKRGYEFTHTPLMAKSDLYKISGHWQHYQKDMFVLHLDSEELALRPMTCPFHFLLYNQTKRSYRDLPIRYAETSTLFRNEASGEMHGLIRVRQFTLSDGHIICRLDQLESEFSQSLNLLIFVLKTLNLKNYTFRFSKWDPSKKGDKYIDDPEAWEHTQSQMKSILDKLKIEYVEAEDEAAFYGPKLDIQMKNVYGKEDTILTIQIDFALPERFDMKYTDNEGQEIRPLVIHRSSIGCYERTIALLLEEYNGVFLFG